jgi:ribosomal protein L34E
MKPNKRFAKKTWKKPPKNEAQGYVMAKKEGVARCAICKNVIASSKRRKIGKSFSKPKSTQRSNRPYGGYLCSSCLKAKTIEATQQLE